ncbi:MAG: DNA polymerase III subunit gamma/tau [Gammaproteobacteria bacterium]|nr:DNA polymerase III subunit gamma/tau [Gammaproteobacteria bacterium]
MSYLVLARKWRPKTFPEVVGQQHVLRALINGLDQDRLHHAFLFSGTRGVGKTTLSRILAKSLNCEQGVSSTPCGECQSCQEVDAGRFVDLIEVDAASRTKVDDTRELLDNVQYAPSRGRYKVYLIDEVHMLSTSSFNALLKTLEEPPPHVKFLFATTDPQKLPVTILSRCLQFNLRRIELEQISVHLATILKQEDITFEADALTALARAADGSMRDALSLLDQAISFGAGNVTAEHVHQMLGTIEQQQLFHIVTALINQDGKTLLQQSQELSLQGRDFNLVLNALLALLQRLATLQLVPDLEMTDEDDSEKLSLLSSQISPESVQLLYQIALHGKRDLPFAADPKSGFDMTLLRMLSFQPKKITTSIRDTDTASPLTEVQQPITPAVQPVSESKPHIEAIEPKKEIYHVQEATPEVVTENIKAEPISNTALSVDNWTSTIANLKLAALSRQLANNCAFIKFDSTKIYLSLAPELAHLATDKAKERLALALQQHLNSTVSVVIEHNDAQHQSSQTLATQQAEHETSRQQQAVESIHNDSTVDAIKHAFNGQVIESTIKPID